MCGYLIIVKVLAKTILTYKCYTYGQRMNMYTLIVYIHGPFDDVMLSYDLQLNVGCDFTYAIKAIVNVDCNCLIKAI
jgi:hypothetical protein